MYTKTSGKEYFYSISGLMIPKYMVHDKLTENIEFFVDWVPRNVDSLKTLVKSDMKQFVSKMEELYILLCSIYAHWLEMEASRILRMAEMNEISLCQQFVPSFTTNLNTMAMDVQTAHSTGFEASYWQRDEIEKCKSVVSSMQIVATLLRRAQFEKAVDFALSINDFRDSAYAVTFMSFISKKNITRALNLIDEVITVYMKTNDAIINKVTAVPEDSRKKIVIVDDMPEALATLETMLRGHYHVFAFSDGQDVLEFIDTSQQPDAFLLDIDMPVMDGLTLAKNIRSRARFENTPLLFLTSDCSRETVVKSALYAAKAFLIKPANKDIIISKLSSCL